MSGSKKLAHRRSGRFEASMEVYDAQNSTVLQVHGRVETEIVS
jgi:hypothetical protein